MVVAVTHEIMAISFGSVHPSFCHCYSSQLILSRKTQSQLLFSLCDGSVVGHANLRITHWRHMVRPTRSLSFSITCLCKLATVSFAMTFQRSSSTFCIDVRLWLLALRCHFSSPQNFRLCPHWCDEVEHLPCRSYCTIAEHAFDETLLGDGVTATHTGICGFVKCGSFSLRVG